MLSKLPDDVLLHMMLQYLEVRDIVVLESVCKALYACRELRYLWLSLLRGLDIDHTPDLPPGVDVSALSAVQLRQIVVNANREFHGWHRLEGPALVRGVLIPRNVLSSDRDAGKILGMKLVSGKDIAVLHRHPGILEFWDIPTKRLMATHTPYSDILHWFRISDSPGSATKLHLNFEVAVDESNPEEVVIATHWLYRRTYMSEETQLRALITRLDGMDVSVLNTRDNTVNTVLGCHFLPRSDCYVKVDGDYAIAHLPELSRVIVVNWRKRVKFTSETEEIFSTWSHSTCLLSRGYLIVSSQNPDRSVSISTIYLPTVLESESLCKRDEKDFDVGIPLKGYLTIVPIPFIRPSSESYPHDYLRLASATYTGWKREGYRHIHIRVCVFDGVHAQVAIAKIHVGGEIQGKPFLTVESIAPRINTEIPDDVEPISKKFPGGRSRKVSASGRFLLFDGYVWDDKNGLRAHLFQRTSFWALTSQERFDSLKADADELEKSIRKSLAIISEFEERSQSLLPSLDRLEVDDCGRALFFQPEGVLTFMRADDIYIWYLS